MEKMWAAKLGIDEFNRGLLNELMALMVKTPVDYTIFFRELSTVPEDIVPLKKSFYGADGAGAGDVGSLEKRWSEWLEKWQSLVGIVIPPEIRSGYK